MSHDAYMDEPAENTDWMLRFQRLEDELDAARPGGPAGAIAQLLARGLRARR